MTRSPPDKPRRAAVVVIIAVATVSFLATRPWSSRNSFRQMRIFAPSERVENFREMDEIFFARVIHRGPAPHRFGEQPLSLPKTFAFRGRDIVVDEFLERTVTTGLLVLHDDTILVERYRLGASADTPMTSWSVAKSIVSLLVGIARAEGRLPELDTPLGEIVQDFGGAAYGKVSLRNALTMSSGIEFSEKYGDPLSDIHTMFARLLYFRESAAHYLASRDAEGAPGTRFHYASTDTFALGLALRRATQTSLADYLERKLWIPLGMEYDASWNTDGEDGTELAFCCLNARLRDFAKIGRLAARGGDWNGKRIVPEEWIRQSTRLEPAREPGDLDGFEWGYQYQWWIPDRDGTFMAAGVWGQFIYVDPDSQLVIVKTSVDEDFEAHGPETVAFFRTVRAQLAAGTKPAGLSR